MTFGNCGRLNNAPHPLPQVSQPLESVNLTLYAKREFANVMKLRPLAWRMILVPQVGPKSNARGA